MDQAKEQENKELQEARAKLAARFGDTQIGGKGKRSFLPPWQA